MGGAALIGGAALLVAGPGSVSALEVGDEARRTVSHEYRLVACESVLPLTCGAGGSTAGLFNAPQGISVDVSAFTAALSPNGAFLGLIGPGGLLIGDGLDGHDAYVDENGVFHAATAGGNGGLLWGNGGNGGRGLDAGVYTVLDPETGELVEKFLHATDGADGGRGGLLWGNGGNGGNGGNVGAFGDPVRADAAGEDVDRLVAGNGGNGGEAEANAANRTARGGAGGNGGDVVGGGTAGNGGNGGKASSKPWDREPAYVPGNEIPKAEDGKAIGGKGGRGGKGVILGGGGNGGNGGDSEALGVGGKATAGAKGVGGRGGLFSKSGQDGTKGSKQDGPSGGID